MVVYMPVFTAVSKMVSNIDIFQGIVSTVVSTTTIVQPS